MIAAPNDIRSIVDGNRPLSRGECLLLSTLSGVLIFLTWPKPSLLGLLPVMLVPLLLIVSNRHVSLRWVWISGHLASFVLILGGFYWVEFVIREFGELPSSISLPLFLAYSSFGSIHIPIIFTAQALICRKLGRMGLALFPGVVMLGEWMVPQLFPWYLGAPMIGFTEAAQLASVMGVMGISAWVALVNIASVGVLTGLIHGKKLSTPEGVWAAVAILVTAGVLSFGYFRVRSIDGAMTAAGPHFSAAIVQASVANADRRESRSALFEDDIFKRYLSLTRALGTSTVRPSLVVWPEVAIPKFFLNSPPLQHELYSLSEETGRALLFGALRAEGENIYNSSFLIGPPRSLLGIYDKVYLLYFGESMPFSNWFPALKNLVPAVGDFSRGAGPTVHTYEGLKILPTICYELIVVDYMHRAMQMKPTVLVNMTNDSWFGDTNEPEEHLLLAQFRALEYRVPLIRAANTGISAIVDGLGRIRTKSALNDQTALEWTLPQDPGLGSTLYAEMGPAGSTGIGVLLSAILYWITLFWSRRNPLGSASKR